MKLSPLAPASYPSLPSISGVRLAAAECNIRYKNRPDVLLVTLDEGTQAAGVFTTSLTAAAPVQWCRQSLASGMARALIVNSGNANAFTGKIGMESVERVTATAASILSCLPHEVMIASTGVIGEPLADDKITGALPSLQNALSAGAWETAARAIMTTDTFMKVATATAEIDGVKITINGIAKGSGMIAPNMATLLSFVFTDASIPASLLQELVAQANQASFNSITVDSDTSTNDTLIAFATGKAAHKPVASLQDPRIDSFKTAFTEVLTDLAIQIVKDGEGAQKLIAITVEGADSDKAAHNIAMTIANSPLVKTAIAGEDANWGRIVMAVGKSGEKVEQERISVMIGGVTVAKDGARAPGYDETPVNAHMKGQYIEIVVGLAMGTGRARVYTCDLTHGYIDINGSYRS
ncbi:MAG TPA: bifunctional glutamate N-acetyltransferase/amino-acid acetyltransferase ArgJ [Rickettsiales bacterium]|nr:bifunctional glutamate N-acetyltransferase/amino-acid acetyltransferase ArgJ [Rickettsiales bacterium]